MRTIPATTQKLLIRWSSACLAYTTSCPIKQDSFHPTNAHSSLAQYRKGNPRTMTKIPPLNKQRNLKFTRPLLSSSGSNGGVWLPSLHKLRQRRPLPSSCGSNGGASLPLSYMPLQALLSSCGSNDAASLLSFLHSSFSFSWLFLIFTPFLSRCLLATLVLHFFQQVKLFFRIILKKYSLLRRDYRGKR